MNIDLIPNGAIKRVHVSQNDVGRTLTFELFNNSTSYTVPSGAVVKIQGTKPSGFGFSEVCTVNGNVATIDTTEAMTDESGNIQTELSISYGDVVIGTSNFVLAVEKNPHPDTTTDGSMETIIPELTLLVNEVKGYAEEIEGTYHAYGSPWVASTVAQMTDTDKIYVYVGSESGYTNGNWYYYNGTAWVSGGVYNSVAVQTDTTLSVSGMPADAKVVGDEVSDLKSDLVSEQDDGLFHRYLTWEHGGIDNATGENNNEGSLTRSRMPEYLLYADYNQVFNGASARIYVIYYDSEYNFVSAAQIDQNQTYIFSSNSSRIYFRLDFRGALDLTKNIKVYQTAKSVYEISTFKENVNTYRHSQFYFKDGTAIIEENSDLKKVYFHSETTYARYGKNGTSQWTGINCTMSNLASQIGTSLVTSPNGVANCIEVGDEYALVFDISTKTFSVVHRYRLTNEHIPLFVQNGGLITFADSSILRILAQTNNADETNEIPSYWNTAIAEAEESINNALSSDENSASFAFVTDTHVGNNRGYSGKLLKKVMDDCHIPAWFHGGDAVTGTPINSKANLIADMNADFEHFADIENIGLRAIGNHDPAFGVSASHDSNLTNGEINHYYHGVDREKYLQQYGVGKGYFYKDITKDKLRCIVLDIVPYESQVNSNDLVTGSNKMWYHQFGSVQLDWFADVLASTPSDYAVVVCSHIAPVSLAELKTLDSNWSESVPIDYLQARKIAEAYALKSTYSFTGTIVQDTTGDSYNIDVDFTSSNGEFVCFFCGHTHKDFILTLDNVKIVGTANDSIAVSSNASSYAPSKTAGTNTEQIIDFFCIKPTTRAVSVVRLGAYLEANGKVRTFTY